MSDTAGVAGNEPARSDIDLYGDEVLTDPYPAYKELRDMGSAVFLEKVDAYFIGRFEDVRSALNDWETFTSTKGIGLNPIINEAWDEALICQDPPVHTERRKIMMEVLSPPALKPIADTIEQRAGALADRLVKVESFDGLADFALDLPVNVVMDLIGWPQDVRPKLLQLAEGSWNAAGPQNARMESGLVVLQEMVGLVTEVYDNNRALPGGFASQLIEASHRGDITRDTAIGMLMGYIVAAFETTISAMAAGVWLYAKFPGEWRKLRENSKLAMSAANEIVRWESPLQNFGRWTTKDVTLSDGAVIPANRRVIVSYASANRDERRFADPDRFQIDRPEKMNLGYGQGPHACAGQGLARMELTAVFGALAKRVERIELTGEAQRISNNIARAFSKVPARVVAS